MDSYWGVGVGLEDAVTVRQVTGQAGVTTLLSQPLSPISPYITSPPPAPEPFPPSPPCTHVTQVTCKFTLDNYYALLITIIGGRGRARRRLTRDCRHTTSRPTDLECGVSAWDWETI